MRDVWTHLQVLMIKYNHLLAKLPNDVVHADPRVVAAVVEPGVERHG